MVEIEEQELAVADPALLSWMRQMNAALVELCEHRIAQDQRLLRIEDAIGRLAVVIERHNALLAEWLDPTIDLGWHLVQLAEIGRKNLKAVAGLATQLAQEHADTREAIDLAVGAAGLDDVALGG